MRTEIVVAVVALIGVLTTAAASRASSRDQARISLLDVTVQRLSERVTALEAALEKAEARRESAEEDERIAKRKLWAVTDYALALLGWGRSMARDLEDPPPEPPAPPMVDTEVL